MSGLGSMIHMQLANLEEMVRRLAAPLPAGIRLRPADLATDLPRIAGLYNAIFARDEDEALTVDEVAGYVRHPGLDALGVFLAFAGEAVVGLAVGKREVPAPGEPGGRGSVELVAVRADYQRRGIGRALVHRALTWLSEQGVERVVAAADHPIVLGLLQKYGFQPAEIGT
jgi:ribosomal protein S18 acetylase RimI-like enzyme